VLHLRGIISSDRPLLVVAVEEEASHLHAADLPILITGVGKVNAAASTAAALATATPSMVINMGTAGGLKAGITGTHVITRVLQHDLNSDAIFALIGHHVGEPIDVHLPAWLPAQYQRSTLASGDVFVSDPAVRDRLAQEADLVDMEGYAVARTARMAGVPALLVKQVSDSADGTAGRTWVETVDECAEVLGHWVREHLR
jgi:adenosylhomocysteine nucleosidase